MGLAPRRVGLVSSEHVYVNPPHGHGEHREPTDENVEPKRRKRGLETLDESAGHEDHAADDTTRVQDDGYHDWQIERAPSAQAGEQVAADQYEREDGAREQYESVHRLPASWFAAAR